MIIEDPDIYLGKKLVVYLNDGTLFSCVGYGYSYDFDESDEEILEITVISEKTGLYCDFTEKEIDSIEIK